MMLLNDCHIAYAMDQAYGVFERLADGTVLWRDLVRGLECARERLDRLASHSDS